VETHVHRQRHFPEAEVLELLAASGLECLDVYGHGFDAVPKQPVEELIHSKAVYISRRAEQRRRSADHGLSARPLGAG
jgi:hypothetical protein